MAWLSGYTYRKKKPVNSTTAGAQTIYQMKLLVGESAGASGEEIDCESHCEDFPNDIRFTKEDGTTKHDYWVKSITGETPNRLATIDIEVASIPASGSVDFYMYYGKSSDSGESNGVTTYPFFDDFEGTSLDTVPTSGDVAVAEDSGKYEAFPGIAKYSNGDLFVVYRTCDSNTHTFDSSGRTVIRKSTDDGENWGSEVVVANDAGIDDRNPGILIFDDDGTETILVVYNTHTGVVASDRAYCRKSTDGGVNWGSKIALSSGNTRHTWNPPIELSNGKILVPIYDFPNTNTYVVESNDGGDNWTEYTATTSYGSEFSIIETKTGGSYTGGVYGLIRDESSPYVYKKVTSTDYGHTWSAVTDESDFDNPYKSPITVHRAPNGELLAVYTTNTTDYLELYESTDEGANWAYKTTLISGASISYYPCLETISSSKLIVVWCVNGATSDVYVNFIDYPISGDMWRTTGSPTIGVSNSILTITCNATEYIESIFTQSPSAILEIRSRDKDYGSFNHPACYGFGKYRGTTYNTYGVRREVYTTAQYMLAANDLSGRDISSGIVRNTNFAVYEIEWTTAICHIYEDDVKKDSDDVTTHIPTGALRANIGRTYYTTEGNTCDIDWIFVRKYASPEPTWGTSGSEETAPEGGHPTMSRWHGIPGMNYTGRAGVGW